MDSVRFGRALGIGARSAAKALAGAVDAAAAPNPGKSRVSAGTSAQSLKQSEVPVRQESANPPARPPAAAPAAYSAPTAAQTAAKTAVRAVSQARQTGQGIARGGKRFGESAWGPVARLSGVLWLEITGSFFGIFALFAASALWARRSEFRAGFSAGLQSTTPAMRDARLHLLVFLAMAIVFGYFSVSSFLRAYRK